jgi:hypothetical protein
MYRCKMQLHFQKTVTTNQVNSNHTVRFLNDSTIKNELPDKLETNFHTVPALQAHQTNSMHHSPSEANT